MQSGTLYDAVVQAVVQIKCKFQGLNFCSSAINHFSTHTDLDQIVLWKIEPQNRDFLQNRTKNRITSDSEERRCRIEPKTL
jgi:hypothetical protein